MRTPQLTGTVQTLALFFNQYVNGIALDALAWRCKSSKNKTENPHGTTASTLEADRLLSPDYIFYCIFLAFEVGIIWFFLVETRCK